MKEFWLNMFKGVNDDVSSKRVITFMSFLCCMFAFLCNVFMEIPLEPHIFDGMLYLTGAGLGFSAFEKFSPATSVPQSKSDDQPPF
jgi:hypothetical protein